VTSRFLRFAIVGTLGFVVDAGVLALVLQSGLAGFHAGRCLSFLAAASFTWALNRRFTFADRAASRGSRGAQWARYVAAMSAGAAVNYAVYALVLHMLGYTGLIAPLAVAAGSIAGLGVNFSAARHLVFAPRR
jgi:putative flippase GtrA